MARPRGATAFAMRRIPDWNRLSQAALAGHAGLFVHPAYARLVNGEPYAKRLIPLLIILFVLALGGMRAVALFQAHSAIEQNAATRLSLLAKSIAGDLADSTAAASLAEPSETLQGLVENALPPLATGSGRSFLFINPDGKIVATAPRQPEVTGSYIDEVLGSSQPLTTLGDRAGVLRLTLVSGEDVIATVHHGEGGIGSLAVLQSL